MDHAALIRHRRRGGHTIGSPRHIVPGDGGEVAADVERGGTGLGRRREGSRREERGGDEEEDEGERRAGSSHGESICPSLLLFFLFNLI